MKTNSTDSTHDAVATPHASLAIHLGVHIELPSAADDIVVSTATPLDDILRSLAVPPTTCQASFVPLDPARNTRHTARPGHDSALDGADAHGTAGAASHPAELRGHSRRGRRARDRCSTEGEDVALAGEGKRWWGHPRLRRCERKLLEGRRSRRGRHLLGGWRVSELVADGCGRRGGG